MNQNQNAATPNQILYAQAVQIALTISGQKPNFNPASAMDAVVQGYLGDHKNLTNQVYAFLRSQPF